MPDLLSAQIPIIKEVLAAYRIPIFEREGFEADDIGVRPDIASVCKQLPPKPVGEAGIASAAIAEDFVFWYDLIDNYIVYLNVL